MIKVELVYDRDCPAAADTRRNLRAAMLGAHLPPRWREWDRSSPATPAQIRAFASPTILINGHDLAGEQATGAAACRIYQSRAGSIAAVPPVAMIRAALNEAVAAKSATESSAVAPAKWLGVMAVPAAVVSLLPALTCPLCWPGYAALLSSFGIGFFASPRYLLPATFALLAIALIGLGLQARGRGYTPLALGAVSAVMIALGKFAVASTAATYAGVALLLFASALSLLRRRRGLSDPCLDCGTKALQDSAMHG